MVHLQTSADVLVQVISDNSRSERRVSPSWTIDTLKTRLEPITGIPVAAQRLSLRGGTQPPINIDADGSVQLHAFNVASFSELRVDDTRPAGLRENYTDVSAVAKYEMSSTDYENRTDSVLAWKKAQKLGRFDPDAPSIEEQRKNAILREIQERGIELDKRCRLLPETDARRGTIKFIGEVPEIPGLGSWIGIVLDEPTGKNDGTIKNKRYFTCATNSGVFIRPERVEVGDFAPLDDFGDDEEF
ncbi:hypothetical protein MBLNU457_7081t1 [Dothideomycetes sp. NU457]